MKSIKYYLFFLILISTLIGNAQVKYNSKIVLSAEMKTPTSIYSTFTEGIVNYTADVRLIYGELYLTKYMPEKADHGLPTFRAGYLLPMYSQYKKQNNQIFANYNEPSYLFVNVKNDVKQTYFKIWEQLEPYKEIISYREGENWVKGKLIVVFVGNISLELIQHETSSFVSVEGSIASLDQKISSDLMPVIGIDFENYTQWDGFGPMEFDEFMRLKELVKKIHRQNKKVRFYNCPEKESIWDVLLTSGVDFITAKNYDGINKVVKEKE